MSKLRKLFWAGLVLSLILLSGCAGDTTDPAPAEPDGENLEAEPDTPKIAFEGTDLDGNTVTSDILSQSKLTMINVWSTDCNPCLSEMPDLGELASEYDASEFQLIGIISNVLEGEDQTAAEALIQWTGADYTHLLLNESIFYALLTDVTAVPTTFFLDQDGVILDTAIGARAKSAWEEKIDALLEKQ